MDDVTLDTLRCVMSWRPEDCLNGEWRPTYWSVSKKLKASARSVRSRLETLTESGVIRGIRIIPDVSLFGMMRTQIIAMVDDASVVRIKEKVRLLDFAESVHLSKVLITSPRLPLDGESSDDNGTSARNLSLVRFELVHEPDDEASKRVVDVLQGLVGGFELLGSETAFFQNKFGKFPDRAVSVLMAIVSRPTATLHDLALKASMNEKTFRKYLRGLAINKAFRVGVTYDFTRLDSIIFIISVRCTRSQFNSAETKLLTICQEHTIWNVSTMNLVGVMCAANNLSEMMRLYHAVRNTPDLAEATLSLAPECIDNQVNTSYARRLQLPSLLA